MSEYTGDMFQSFLPFERRMREDGIHALVINAFKRNYLQLVSGSTGSIARSQIMPVHDVPDASELDAYEASGSSVLHKTVAIKLNGGLGTSMGLDKAKSLIELRDSMSFLDIIVQQILHLRKRADVNIPLLLMNSFATHEDSMALLGKWPELDVQLPLDFLQNRVPKVFVHDYSPAVHDSQAELEWCPPGHGDIYVALQTSGLLDALLNRGIEFAFISNADNLGAVIDTGILGYFADSGLEFLMEVADRTAADRKGGHLARLTDGRLTLRERAQCPEQELEEFQDIELYKYFNTNSLWIHLPSLRNLLTRFDGLLPLPLIRNMKSLDPKAPDSPAVYQLETAMGAAISLFERSGALRVSRHRFAPVKTTDDLLAVRSDIAVLTDDFRIVPNPSRRLGPIDITLDQRYYKFIDQFDERFPHGPPSLIDCASLRITGDVTFGRDIVLRGNVHIDTGEGNVRRITDGSVVEGK